MVEDTVVVAGDEYAEFRRDGRVPGEEVLQVGRVEAFASVTGTDEDVGFGWYGKPPIHHVGFGECKDCMSFEWNYHRISKL